MTDVLPILRLLEPSARARLNYTDASCSLTDRLWRAALGDPDPLAGRNDASGDGLRMPYSALFDGYREAMTPSPVPTRQPPTADLARVDVKAHDPSSFKRITLGPNDIHADAIEAAAHRTGLPPAALAATIDSEAGKVTGGGWNVMSRNPRSSAAGLGQFLCKTWEGEAERRGTFLHAIAQGRGWIGADGHVAPAARSVLLALRYEPRVAIEAIADYARTNLDRLKDAGIRLEHGADAVAHAAYLAHHLGPGDVVRFLRGGIGEGRAAHLLTAQVGESEAVRRIAVAGGDAVEAHRTWLLSFVDRHVRPGRFA